jgi:hypothetical protein
MLVAADEQFYTPTLRDHLLLFSSDSAMAAGEPLNVAARERDGVAAERWLPGAATKRPPPTSSAM